MLSYDEYLGKRYREQPTEGTEETTRILKPRWEDWTDTLGLACPQCDARKIHSVPFTISYDDAGEPNLPEERSFTCATCKHQFRVRHDEWEKPYGGKV